MQAVCFTGHGRASVQERPLPRPAAGEVLLQVRRTALCGSDAKLWHKGAAQVPGHEIFGLVQQPGHALHGRRCVVYIPVHCGHCAACRAGCTQCCEPSRR
jgi:threonine dehydrogenase-like Zn-dependent dehydrogenase